MIKELLTKHGLMFYDRGKQYVVRCLNPEHEDKNPSMNIDKETGKFYCFSCKFGGSLPKLKSLLGEPNDESPSTLLEYKMRELKAKLNRIGAATSTEDFDLPVPRSSVPLYRNVDSHVYDKFGAFISNREEFTNRLWVPVTHHRRIVGLQGRSMLDELQPKYMFMPQHMQLKPVILGIEHIPGKVVILTEGIFDMLRLHTMGLTEGCSILGSYFDFEKVYTLLTYSIELVVTCFDPDKSGRACTEQTKRTLKKYAPHIAVESIHLDGDDDPGSMSDIDILNTFGTQPFSKFFKKWSKT